MSLSSYPESGFQPQMQGKVPVLTFACPRGLVQGLAHSWPSGEQPLRCGVGRPARYRQTRKGRSERQGPGSKRN